MFLTVCTLLSLISIIYFYRNEIVPYISNALYECCVKFIRHLLSDDRVVSPTKKIAKELAIDIINTKEFNDRMCDVLNNAATMALDDEYKYQKFVDFLQSDDCLLSSLNVTCYLIQQISTSPEYAKLRRDIICSFIEQSDIVMKDKQIQKHIVEATKIARKAIFPPVSEVWNDMFTRSS